ncbi:hypothetical protein SRHO_G00306090 [Serrasalmus rhombeus]
MESFDAFLEILMGHDLRWQSLTLHLANSVQITLGSITLTLSTQETLRICQRATSWSFRVCHRFTRPACSSASVRWSPATFLTPVCLDPTLLSSRHR